MNYWTFFFGALVKQTLRSFSLRFSRGRFATEIFGATYKRVPGRDVEEMSWRSFQKNSWNNIEEDFQEEFSKVWTKGFLTKKKIPKKFVDKIWKELQKKLMKESLGKIYN